MAIQIRRKEDTKPVLEPEVLSAGGNQDEQSQTPNEAAPSDVKVPGLDDNFLQKSNSAMAWLMENRRMVSLVAVIIACIAFGYLGIQHAKESAAIDRSNVLSPAIVTYTLKTEAEAAAIEKANREYLKSQGIAAESKEILTYSEKVPDDRVRYRIIEKHLVQNLDQLKGEEIEATGRLMQAGTAAHHRAAADVTPIYLAAEKSNVADIRLFSLIGQAEMLIGEKKYDEALMVLDNIMNVESAMSSYATLEKARIFEIQGKKDDAIAAYDQIIKNFGQPADQQKALERLRFLTPDWASHNKPAPAAPAVQAAL